MPRLAAGMPAPEFTCTDLSGKSWSLSQVRGKKTLLAFHRFAACPFCNFRVHQLKVRHPQLRQRGLAQVLAFFESGVQPLTTLSERQAVLPFPVLPDPEHKVYDAYGLETSALGLMKMAPRMGNYARNNREAGVSVDGITRDGTVTRMPADFLVDEHGIIRLAFYGKDAGDHVPFEAIESWLGPS